MLQVIAPELSPLESFSWVHGCCSHIFQLHACMLSHFSHIRLFVTLWTVTHQPSLSMGFSRQEYWSRLPCPTPGDLPEQESNLCLSPALAGGFYTTSATCFIFQLVLTKCLTPSQHPVNLCQSHTSKVKIYHWGHVSCVLKGLHSAEPNLKLYWASGRKLSFHAM